LYDLAVIGGGPGGYAAALYAHNFDLSVALVEADKVGGTCLHRGCIPAKSWLQTAETMTRVASAGDFGVISSPPTLDWERARERKNAVVARNHTGLSGLLKRRGVDVIEGRGRILSPGMVEVDSGAGVTQRVEAKQTIVATGSRPRSIPGFEVDGVRVVTSDHALDWRERPPRVAVIGAGAIGVEFASMLADFGSEVHLFEIAPQILPGMDEAAAKVLKRALSKKGVAIHTGSAVEAPVMGDGGPTLSWAGETVEVDTVLVAVGRAPNTSDVGLETTSAKMEGEFVMVDAATMQTAEAGVYAVGDIVAGTPQLAHAGFAEGIAAVTHIATGVAQPVDYRAIPLVVYTDPEVAAVGMTSEQAAEAGVEVEVHEHSFAAVARAAIQGHTAGTARVIVEKGGPIMGATITGPQAGELIHEMMFAVGWEAMPSEAASFIHAHPTLAEAVGETLLAAAGRSLH